MKRLELKADPRWKRAWAAYMREDWPNLDVQHVASNAAIFAKFLLEREYADGPGDAVERLLDFVDEVEANASPVQKAA